MQVPPRSFSSTSATDHPKSASRNARGLPPWPEPTMMASYFMRGFLQREMPQDFTSAAITKHKNRKIIRRPLSQLLRRISEAERRSRLGTRLADHETS